MRNPWPPSGPTSGQCSGLCSNLCLWCWSALVWSPTRGWPAGLHDARGHRHRRKEASSPPVLHPVRPGAGHQLGGARRHHHEHRPDGLAPDRPAPPDRPGPAVPAHDGPLGPLAPPGDAHHPRRGIKVAAFPLVILSIHASNILSTKLLLKARTLCTKKSMSEGMWQN